MKGEKKKMCKNNNRLIKDVEFWMKKFYNWSSEDDSAEKFEEFKALKGILDKHRTVGEPK